MNLKKFFVGVILLILPLIAFADNRYKVVSSRNLNVRKAPSTQSAVIGSLAPSTVISVIEIKDGWAKFLFNGKESYVSSTFITKVIEETPVEVEPIVTEAVKAPEPKETPEPVPESGTVDKAKKIRKKYKQKSSSTMFEKPVIKGFLSKEFDIPSMSGKESVESQFKVVVNGGMANLVWDLGDSEPIATFGARAEFSHHFSVGKGHASQLCSNLSLGFQMKGAAALAAPCMVLELQPIGFSFPVAMKDSRCNGKFSGLAGVFGQMGLGQISADETKFNIKPGFGFCVTGAFELPHWDFSISYERGLSRFVDSSLNLYDYCIMFSVSRTILSF